MERSIGIPENRRAAAASGCARDHLTPTAMHRSSA
jgi:hypothetical protein